MHSHGTNSMDPLVPIFGIPKDSCRICPKIGPAKLWKLCFLDLRYNSSGLGATLYSGGVRRRSQKSMKSNLICCFKNESFKMVKHTKPHDFHNWHILSPANLGFCNCITSWMCGPIKIVTFSHTFLTKTRHHWRLGSISQCLIWKNQLERHFHHPVSFWYHLVPPFFTVFSQVQWHNTLPHLVKCLRVRLGVPQWFGCS